jgi:hypothetical protein
VNILIVYVLEIANDSWEISGVFKDKEVAKETGERIVESESNNYEHYLVTQHTLV